MTDLRTAIAGGIAVVTIDRPPVNALTIASYREVASTFARLSADDSVRCVVLTGAGERAFCAGFDFRAFSSDGDTEDDPRRPEVLRQMFAAIRRCRVPVIGAINGAAIGSGCVLATVCDTRIASEAARFGLPEIDFHRIGGAAYLAPLVSPGMLRRMAFTGRPIAADEALRLGLVEEVVAADLLAEAAERLARLIAGKTAVALHQMKAALNQIEQVAPDQAYRIEQEHSAHLRAVTAERLA